MKNFSMITRRGLAALAVGLVAAGSAAAQDKPPIKIGLSQALSGGLAAGGKAALLSYRIWADEVNEKGGLLGGRKVEIVVYDDQTNPATVPGIYTKLLDVDKVDLLLSSYGTVPTAAAMPVVMQREKMMLSLLALGLGEKFGYDRYFQIMPTGPSARTELSNGFFSIAMGLDPKPKTVAMVGADAEYSQLALDGARENAKKLGLRIVYDHSYPPNTTEFVSIVRAIKATNPDIVFVASYPPDTAGIVRAVSEVGMKTMLFGGGMVGLQFAALKTQLGPLLNGITSFDVYVPEPTMNNPAIEAFLQKYRARAGQEGVDPLGIYIPPLAYAQGQILEQAIKAVGSLDDAKLAEYMHKTTFDTILGKVKFHETGEWDQPRLLQVQYQGIDGSGLEQFKQPGKQVILYPPSLKSGTVQAPFERQR